MQLCARCGVPFFMSWSVPDVRKGPSCCLHEVMLHRILWAFKLIRRDDAQRQLRNAGGIEAWKGTMTGAATTAKQICNRTWVFVVELDQPLHAQVLTEHGVGQATLDAAVRAQLAEAYATSAIEDGVAAVLLESAAAEVARLRAAAEGAATAQASLQRLNEVRLSLSVLCTAHLCADSCDHTRAVLVKHITRTSKVRAVSRL